MQIYFNCKYLCYIFKNFGATNKLFYFINDQNREDKLSNMIKCHVTFNPNTLKIVPENMKTEEMCKMAVKANYWTLEFVPENMKTEEMCKMAVKENIVPQKNFNRNVYSGGDISISYIIRINKDRCALKFVPEHMKTEELCKMAVNQNGRALKFVPEHMKTEELCKIALNQNESVLKFVPKK